MGIDTKKVLAKVEGRTYAKQVFNMIEIDEESVEFREAFWLKFISLIPIPPNVEVPELKRPTMTEEEAKRFERRRIPFGMHSNTYYVRCPTIIPIEYLVWLSEESEKLASYLRSDRGQRRQEEDL